MLDILPTVGLGAHFAERFPHELSGGERQRVSIARALIVSPPLVVADEPVSALDVSVRSQIVNLLLDLQSQMNLTYVFIAHDLSTVKHISHRIAVMYLGQLVELGTTRPVFEQCQHPYTKALLASVLIPDPTRRDQSYVLEGEVPSPLNPPSGCYFSTRCPFAQERCSAEEPALRDMGDGHWVRCHFVEELDLSEEILAPSLPSADHLKIFWRTCVDANINTRNLQTFTFEFLMVFPLENKTLRSDCLNCGERSWGASVSSSLIQIRRKA